MSEIHVFYIGAVIAGILLVEALYLLFADAKASRGSINRRMKIAGPGGDVDREAVLMSIRKERGLTADGERSLKMAWLGDLVVQSGLTMGVGRLLAICAVAGLVAAAATFVFLGGIMEPLAALAVGGGLLPLMVLRSKRNRRHLKFGMQLPEAIELIVRSLKAGHPVPVAVALVGRELPDPIGTEFGMIADEVTYGSDLVTALRKMQARVGQEDLPLFITAVSIQTSTGGNLREILQGLADVIRQRIKMRRKIRSISAEGRMSANILTALPILLGFAVMWMSPDFYGSVWPYTDTKIGLAMTFGWLVIGNLMMRKMVNFKF